MIDKCSGRIIVCGDYEGDVHAIVDSLNSLRWSFGDGERQTWAVEHGKDYISGMSEREIIVLNGNVPCPSLRPMAHFVVFKNGERCFADDVDESWKADGALDWYKCTLRELSALISPHLTKGMIEFVAAHASGGYVSHERLLVRSDGYAEWHNCDSSNRFGGERWTRGETEHYPLGWQMQ